MGGGGQAAAHMAWLHCPLRSTQAAAPVLHDACRTAVLWEAQWSCSVPAASQCCGKHSGPAACLPLPTACRRWAGPECSSFSSCASFITPAAREVCGTAPAGGGGGLRLRCRGRGRVLRRPGRQDGGHCAGARATRDGRI